jgi:hypothetical protein
MIVEFTAIKLEDGSYSLFIKVSVMHNIIITEYFIIMVHCFPCRLQEMPVTANPFFAVILLAVNVQSLNDRIDCHPEPGVTQGKCQQRQCIWNSEDTTVLSSSLC